MTFPPLPLPSSSAYLLSRSLFTIHFLSIHQVLFSLPFLSFCSSFLLLPFPFNTLLSSLSPFLSFLLLLQSVVFIPASPLILTVSFSVSLSSCFIPFTMTHLYCNLLPLSVSTLYLLSFFPISFLSFSIAVSRFLSSLRLHSPFPSTYLRPDFISRINPLLPILLFFLLLSPLK